MNRHRQQAFPSPVEVPEMAFEQDPERALWVPGRKRIFLPAPRQTPPTWTMLSLSWQEAFVKTDAARARELARWERMLETICDCSPSRGVYLTQPADQIQPRVITPRNYRPIWRGW